MLEYMSGRKIIENRCLSMSVSNGLDELLLDKTSIAMSLQSKMKQNYFNENTFAKRSKKVLETIWNAFRRTISLFDLLTDARLLYLVSRAQALLFSVILSVSIISPYIVSYSCGIKLFFINNQYACSSSSSSNGKNDNKYNKNEYVALKKILMYFGISPFGVFYFIFLDILDALFGYYKLLVIFLFGKSEMEMKLLEETMANQLGISRMDYEGIKRQRTGLFCVCHFSLCCVFHLLLCWFAFVPLVFVVNHFNVCGLFLFF